jgi:predicted DsbA family dithiol-disulfide isomerase
MKIAIYSDVICPWCWIGKRRLEQALSALPHLQADVSWHPFQLNPQMPAGGMPRADYRRRKFGSADYAQALDARVSAVAQQDHLAFDLAAQKRTPNTILAHRLIWLAGRRKAQDGMVEALFRAYFSAGLDLGDAAVLTGLAADQGHDPSDIASFLSSTDGHAEVLAEEQHMRQSGMDGVPLFVINGHDRISGAQPVAVFVSTLTQLATAPAADGDCADGQCRS